MRFWRAGEGVSDGIGGARSVSGGDGKLRDKGQLALLVARLGGREAVEGRVEGFVIGEEEKGAALKMVSEVEEGRMDCK